MADVKRWNVTYTKHIKQKRKVYQEGFIDLHTSTNKIMLFDDCKKLLECRILKKDEIVSNGETLTFSGYLLDVGDPEGDHGPLCDLNIQIQRRVKKEEDGARMLHRQFIKNSIPVEEGKANAEKNKARINSLSPSQKIIREFKKSELQKYGARKSSPDATNSSITEWEVLYTAQVTQKAKKYHDGFLRLSTCGSLGRQVMLFDGSKLLISRFLKKDEVIRSGESIAFDAYLVDIGDKRVSHISQADPKIHGNDCNVVRGSKKIHGQNHSHESSESIIRVNCSDWKKSEVHKYSAWQSSPSATKSTVMEWQVLYTTHITQKAKKYDDGFLEIATSGLLKRQAMLYDINKKLLDSRFLKKDEVIKTAESIAFEAHLVDIGEPKGDHGYLIDLNFEERKCIDGKTGIMNGQLKSFEANKSIVAEWHALYTTQITQKAKKYQSGILRLASCGSYRMQVTLLNEDKTFLGSKYISLSEDVRTGKTFALPKYLVEVGEPYITPEGKPQRNVFSGSNVNSNVSINITEGIESSNIVPTKKSVRNANQIMSILQKPMAQESTVAGHTDKKMASPISSNKGHQVSDSVILTLPEDCEFPKAPMPHRESSEDKFSGESCKNVDIRNPRLNPAANGRHLSEDAEVGNSGQSPSDIVEVDIKGCDEAFAFGSACASDGPGDDEKKIPEEHKSIREMDECPSFDLRF